MEMGGGGGGDLGIQVQVANISSKPCLQLQRSRGATTLVRSGPTGCLQLGCGYSCSRATAKPMGRLLETLISQFRSVNFKMITFDVVLGVFKPMRA